MATRASSQKTVLFALGLAPKKIGGIEKLLRYFALESARRGWRAVFCFDGEISPLFQAYMQGTGSVLEQLRHQRDLGLRGAGQLSALLDRYRPRCFVYAFHGVMRCFPWQARLAGCSSIVFYDHSSRPSGFTPKPLSLPRRIVGRVLTFPLKKIVSVSRFTRDSGAALGTAKTENIVLANGIELRSPDPSRGQNFRARFAIPADAPVVTQVAWMMPVKGVDVMIRAAALVLQRAPETHFVLAGDGERIQEYRALATELGVGGSVTFTGLVNDPTGEGLFDATDIYCQPSLWQEACPLAVLEAMSFRIPVVASRVGGLPEIVAEGVTGLLCPPSDATALADALLALLQDRPMRERLGATALEHVSTSHRIEDVAARFCDIVLDS